MIYFAEYLGIMHLPGNRLLRLAGRVVPIDYCINYEVTIKTNIGNGTGRCF